MSKFKFYYLNGYTYFEICDLLNINYAENVELIDEITPEDIQIHNQNLFLRIRRLYNKGLSVNAINKQLLISKSVIKDAINQ